MEEKYLKLNQKYNEEIDECANNGFLEQLMNNKLSNSSEATDYDGWYEGSVDFQDENFDILMKRSGE